MMDQVSMKMKTCSILSFVIITVSLLCVGVICLAAALKFVEAHDNLQAVSIMLSYIMLTLGTPSAAKQLSQMFANILPG